MNFLLVNNLRDIIYKKRNEIVNIKIDITYDYK